MTKETKKERQDEISRYDKLIKENNAILNIYKNVDKVNEYNRTHKNHDDDDEFGY